MIEALAEFEPRVALGILARLALDVEDDGIPAAAARSPHEDKIRKAVLAQVRRNVGLAEDDVSPAAIDRVTDALDEELERIAGKTDTDEVLKKLAATGNLPSDLYTINIIPNVRDLYQDHWLEMSDAILKTIREAEKEQHFGENANKEIPALISLFSKFFPNQYPYRSYTLLVIGKRDGLRLDVHQTWKLYPDTIEPSSDESLLDIYKRFALAYGYEFEINGVSSKFQLTLEQTTDTPLVQRVKIKPQFKNDSKGKKIARETPETMMSFFNSASPDGRTLSSLVVVFNLDKYRAMLKAHA